MKKFDSGNASEVDLPDDIDISPILIFLYLYKYHESNDKMRLYQRTILRRKLKELNKYWIRELVRAQEEKITMSIW